MRGTGLCFILCGPSGVGKSTLTNHLLEKHTELELSVSFTTRAPRGVEQDGVHYNFVDRAEFETMAAAGEFAEWAEVHGNLYGTHAETISKMWESGRNVAFDIDYQGAKQLKARYLERAVATLVLPPSLKTLEKRLRGRGTDDDATIAVRMRNAIEEMSQYALFDYVIENDELSAATERLHQIYEVSGWKSSLLKDEIERFLEG